MDFETVIRLVAFGFAALAMLLSEYAMGRQSSFHRKFCDYIVDQLSPNKVVIYCNSKGLSKEESSAVYGYAQHLVDRLLTGLENDLKTEVKK